MIKRANNKKKKGFTLIELIIVLAVMAIIALIAIPNFAAVRNNSKNKADLQSCETIKRTVLMLVSDETVIVKTGTTISFVPGTATAKNDTNELSEEEAGKIDEALKEVKAPQGNKIVSTDGTKPIDATSGCDKYSITINDGEVVVKTVEK
ncbi:MAG TPA: type II secretion system protein [Clostridium sp.]|nr:type II secretion system protein [Clostridium sp.]